MVYGELTKSNTPGSCKHEKTEEHDCGILNQTETTTHPITNNTNEDLANDDTNDFEVFEG
jgi:predicted nucleic acid binding AN1-type Zn finger protein